MLFEKARLKLTALYLVIIMAISLSFSAFIYHSFSNEIQRRFNAVEKRLELQKRGFQYPPGQIHFFTEEINLSRYKVLTVLIYTNSIIFIFSAAAGYFLAGKTLQPIEKTYEDQKRFIADASHELKTPLTILKSSIEVALRDKKLKTKDLKKLLKENLSDIDSLTKLTNDLLSLTRYQQNGSKLEKKKTDIKKVIEKAVKEITPLSKKSEVKIINKSKSKILSLSEESIQKLITILIDNALKYTPKKGSVKISSKLTSKHYILSISDTGIGISEKDLPYIFDRFYRVDPSRSRKNAPGFGLGLSLAKKIVHLHGGKIKVKSKLKKGTTFNIYLPKPGRK